MLQPQGIFGIDGTLSLSLTQAESAAAVAAVGEVDVQSALIFISDCHNKIPRSGLFNTKEVFSVFQCDAGHFLGGQSLDLRDGLTHITHLA